MSTLKLEHITKQYGSIRALSDINLETTEKSFIVLAGPSGCGKTTLLQIIAGLIPFDEGKVYMDDICMNELPAGKRNIAMVFQDAALFPHLSVYENISFGLAYSGMAKETIQKNIQEVTGMLGITDLLKRTCSTLSGGQKQRVAIARALVRKPSLFLMDEPLSALDARLKTQLRMEIAQLYRKTEATFVYVTHDQMEAMTLADCLVIMKDGRMQQVGTPGELYRNPQNLFVANFLGKYEINCFDAYIQDHFLYWHEHRLPLRQKLGNQKVCVAVRCEHMVEEEAGISAEIVLLEQAGDEVYYHLRTEEGTVVMKGNVHRLHPMGTTLRIAFHWRNAFVFDELGQRIPI